MTTITATLSCVPSRGPPHWLEAHQGSLVRHLLLDTTTLIAFERGSFDITGLDDGDLAIAVVTVAEFRAGIELADSADRAAARARTLDAILSAVTVLDYTEPTAAEHARLLEHVLRTGRHLA